MGYTTEFTGKVTVEPPLTLAEYQFYHKLGTEDQRDKGPWQLAEAPGYYCQWVPSEDGASFAWDGNEKFYDSVEWMQLIVRRLAAAGHTVNGSITAQGEDSRDHWKLVVENNKVEKRAGRVVYD